MKARQVETYMCLPDSFINPRVSIQDPAHLDEDDHLIIDTESTRMIIDPEFEKSGGDRHSEVACSQTPPCMARSRTLVPLGKWKLLYVHSQIIIQLGPGSCKVNDLYII